MDSGGAEPAQGKGADREVGLWNGVPGSIGIYGKDRKRGVHKDRDGGWKSESAASLKPREGGISRGRKWAMVSEVTGRLDVGMGPWPVVRTAF